MKKERYYFGFRFENEMKDRILLQMKKQIVRYNQFVENAFLFATKLHDQGKLPFLWKSSFIIRPNRTNKFDTMLILKNDIHEMVRNYAFSYRTSMAEILRVSLEVYLDFLESEDGKIDNSIHYYDQPVPVIQSVLARLIPAFHNGIPPDKYNIVTKK